MTSAHHIHEGFPPLMQALGSCTPRDLRAKALAARERFEANQVDDKLNFDRIFPPKDPAKLAEFERLLEASRQVFEGSSALFKSQSLLSKMREGRATSQQPPTKAPAGPRPVGAKPPAPPPVAPRQQAAAEARPGSSATASREDSGARSNTSRENSSQRSAPPGPAREDSAAPRPGPARGMRALQALRSRGDELERSITAVQQMLLSGGPEVAGPLVPELPRAPQPRALSASSFRPASSSGRGPVGVVVPSRTDSAALLQPAARAILAGRGDSLQPRGMWLPPVTAGIDLPEIKGTTHKIASRP